MIVKTSKPLSSLAQISHYSLYSVLAMFLLALSACGAGSGASSSENIQLNNTPGTNTKVTYSGPLPSSSDVLRFKQAVWDKLVEPTRGCYNCHGDNNAQSTQFVRSDNINTAYQLTRPLVDFSNVSNSTLVRKMAEDHNCWRDLASACADDMETFLNNWINSSNGSSTEVQLSAPPYKQPGNSKAFPASSASFATSIYPLLTQYCSSCHVASAPLPQSPFFASSDVDVAYEAAKSKINLQNPEQSRLAVRLFPESHNCWNIGCQASYQAMLTAIQQFVAAIPTNSIDPSLVTSGAMTLLDGILASSGGRVDTNTIALYQFKTGSGSKVFDNSGILPALDLQLTGDVSWVGGWGIKFGEGGKAQGSVANSRKLHQRISSSGEYSIEAWAAPANVTQEGPARIISYSANTMERNFTLGQTLYSYNFLHRSSTTNANGEPALNTNNAAELLQASLQHIVVTFSPVDGRKIYVNGQYSGDVDTENAGNLNDWNDTFALILGNEASSDRPWAGVLKLVAIHDKALNQETISKNFSAGVGEKFYLMFDVSSQVGINQSYIVFEVSEFDDYSYLFNKPFFASLSPNATLNNIPVKGIRIGINGRLLPIGQAFQNLDFSLNTQAYNEAGQRLPLSSLGAVISQEKGSSTDEFFLSFERLGSAQNVIIEPAPTTPSGTVTTVPRPDIGLKVFSQINADMSEKTGVPMHQHSEIKTLYEQVIQQLPGVSSIDSFLSSQQMAITQLAIKYCNRLIEEPTLLQNYFPGLNLNQAPAQAFSNTDLLLNPLLNRMLSSGANQPSEADVKTALQTLITRLSQCNGGISCDSQRSKTIAKASCSALLGSAVTLIH